MLKRVALESAPASPSFRGLVWSDHPSHATTAYLSHTKPGGGVPNSEDLNLINNEEYYTMGAAIPWRIIW